MTAEARKSKLQVMCFQSDSACWDWTELRVCDCRRMNQVTWQFDVCCMITDDNHDDYHAFWALYSDDCGGDAFLQQGSPAHFSLQDIFSRLINFSQRSSVVPPWLLGAFDSLEPVISAWCRSIWPYTEPDLTGEKTAAWADCLNAWD